MQGTCHLTCCWCLQALPAEGRLYALDKDKRTMEMAERHWEMAGVSDKVWKSLKQHQEAAG